MGQDAPTLPTRDIRPRTPGPKRGFALLSAQFLDELRSRVTLSTLVGRTVPLKRAGNEYKACCPFHQEKTPSFWVNDQKGFYHCFGCQAHGDAIRWLTEVRGLAFMDAVTQLAQETGLELPRPEPEEIARRERASSQHEMMEAAAAYFEKLLHGAEGSVARDYLRKRDVGETPIAEFRLGYAKDGRGNLTAALKEFTQDELVEAGLLISVENKEPYDRFRNRLMFPIRDPRGRVIAFGGRILGEGEPKYLNSPDTFLFDKGRVLFNLDRAAPASRQAHRIVVVEGYLDVIALDQAGIREAVAPMGTALTESQLEQLWRLVDEPTLCFDGDSAGRKAAKRAVERAMPSLRSGKQLRIALLPEGRDPDDIIQQGGARAFEAFLSSALPLSTFLYAVEREKIDAARPEQRAALRQRLEDIAKSCEDRFVADEFARSLRSLFFEEFGWKKDQRRAIVNAAILTSPRVAPNLARLYVRSALYGLTRFPEVAAANLETVAAIPISHPQLQRWRDGINAAVTLNPSLDHDGILAALEVHVLPEAVQFDIQSDLRFGFTKRNVDPEQGKKQVETLIDFLAEEHDLNGQLHELDQAAVEDGGRGGYEAIESARQRLREARAGLFQRGRDWAGEL